jgi:hypothetical protein
MDYIPPSWSQADDATTADSRVDRTLIASNKIVAARRSTTSTMETSSSFFSLSSSLTNSLSSSFMNAPRSRYVDIKNGGHVISVSSSSSSISKWIPKRNASRNSGAQDAGGSNQSQEWTAVERAKRARDSVLLSLFEVEVGESGVVTTAGYKAVHQKFLYSNAVEEEMNRRGLDRRRNTTHLTEARGSLFGDLVKSIQRGCSSDDVISMAKKIGLGSDGASVENHGPLSSSTFSDHNLAPRRASINMESPAPSVQSLSEKDWEDLQELDEDSVDSVTAKYSFVSSREDDKKPGQCRIQTKARVILSEVCLDPDEIDVRTNNMYGSEREDDDASSVNSFSSKRSYKDECGWLPWPVEQD